MSPPHLITLGFDDGFAHSSIRTAEIFEKFGVRAAFNVIATGSDPNFVQPDPSHNAPKADFGFWNELKARGHEIMPHGFRHADKSKLPLAEAQDLILRCLDIFDRKLDSFDRKSAIFNFPYNASTPQLDAWLATQVRASRSEGPRGGFGLNALPTRETIVIRSDSFGPENCDAHLDRCVTELLKRPSGWLVFAGHGLEEEGWGPMSAKYLQGLLARLVEMPSVRVVPTAEAFRVCEAM